MFSKNQTLRLLLSFFLLACAKPNYQNISSNFSDANKDSVECALPLKKLDQCVRLTWVQESNDSHMGIFNLDFTKAMTNDVRAVLWMPSMGHGSRPTTIARLSETQFQISNVAFIMPGEWEIRIQLVENNQVVDEVTQKIIY